MVRKNQTKAQSAVSEIYGISLKLSKEEIEGLIKKLLRKAAFTFCDLEKVFSCLISGVFTLKNALGKRGGHFSEVSMLALF